LGWIEMTIDPFCELLGSGPKATIERFWFSRILSSLELPLVPCFHLFSQVRTHSDHIALRALGCIFAVSA
jgi:hypothetical protein